MVSDLHSHIYGENQEDFVSLIKKQEPDIIALVGDIADDEVPVKGTELFLSNIKGIAPIYYVTGNHEYWSGDIGGIKKLIRSYGVTILEQNYERINLHGSDIIIGGIDDPDSQIYEYGGLSWHKRMHAALMDWKMRPDIKYCSLTGLSV
jgi:predicted MPP superfamily phosphohydrolase